MLAPDAHTEAVRHLTAADERLAAVIERIGPCAMRTRSPTEDHFESLVVAIVSQQLSSKAANTIYGRVKTLGLDSAGRLSPDVLLAQPETKLRGAGLSGQKASYVRDLCERVRSGDLALATLGAMDDEEVITSLRRIKGIGRWTAEMFLMFSLGRPDVLPVDDLGVKKGMMRLFSLRKVPAADKMVKLAKPFRPHRSVACWYLWRLCEEKPAPR